MADRRAATSPPPRLQVVAGGSRLNLLLHLGLTGTYLPAQGTESPQFGMLPRSTFLPTLL